MTKVRKNIGTLKTINGVKARLEELKKSLPEGVEIVTVYDRSGLINRAIENLTGKLIEEIAVVALVCIIFLLHFRSAFVAIFTLPVAILISFLLMYKQGVNANIMSLGGIAIAIGVMVDAAIVMIENAHKHLEFFQAASLLCVLARMRSRPLTALKHAWKNSRRACRKA